MTTAKPSMSPERRWPYVHRLLSQQQQAVLIQGQQLGRAPGESPGPFLFDGLVRERMSVWQTSLLRTIRVEGERRCDGAWPCWLCSACCWHLSRRFRLWHWSARPALPSFRPADSTILAAIAPTPSTPSIVSPTIGSLGNFRHHLQPRHARSRWQMALFLGRSVAALGQTLPSGADQGLTDIAVSMPPPRPRSINSSKWGSDLGTSPTTFGPIGTVPRWQMALFLTRLLVRVGVGIAERRHPGLHRHLRVRSRHPDRDQPTSPTRHLARDHHHHFRPQPRGPPLADGFVPGPRPRYCRRGSVPDHRCPFVHVLPRPVPRSSLTVTVRNPEARRTRSPGRRFCRLPLSTTADAVCSTPMPGSPVETRPPGPTAFSTTAIPRPTVNGVSPSTSATTPRLETDTIYVWIGENR